MQNNKLIPELRFPEFKNDGEWEEKTLGEVCTYFKGFAFQNGFEIYGVDILNRTLELIRKHQGDLPVAYKPDGTVDEGIPDNWGQAAVLSALVEGLAGVVDKSHLFGQVELSPRWMATGKNEAAVTVAYGPSGKTVSYQYAHIPKNKQITYRLSGDPEQYTLRVLLPPNQQAAQVLVDGKRQNSTTEKVQNSLYVVVTGLPKGQQEVVVRYK